MLGIKIFPAFADLRIAKLVEEVFNHIIQKWKDYSRFMNISTHNITYGHFPHQFENGLIRTSFELQLEVYLTSFGHLLHFRTKYSPSWNCVWSNQSLDNTAARHENISNFFDVLGRYFWLTFEGIDVYFSWFFEVDFVEIGGQLSIGILVKIVTSIPLGQWT